MSSRPSSNQARDRGDGRVVHGHPPLLVALAQHRDRPATQVDVGAVEAAEPENAQPGGIEQLEDGQVPPVHGVACRHVGAVQDISPLESTRGRRPPPDGARNERAGSASR